MKKVLSLTLVLALLLSLSVSAVAANATVANAGDTITVNVVTEGTPDLLSSIGYYVDYDRSAVEWVSGGALTRDGSVLVGQIDTAVVPTGFAFPAGVVASLTFKALKDGVDGSGFSIYLDYMNVLVDNGGSTPNTYLDVVIDVVTYTVTVNGGSGSGQYAKGETVSITAGDAPTGMQFDYWEVVSGSAALADATSISTSFVMPAEDVEVTAHYKDHDHVWGTEWVDGKDGYHYHVCTVEGCDAKDYDTREAHIYVDGTCDKCGAIESSGEINNIPGSTVTPTYKNPFTDVSADAYYYEAVKWAVENGITYGLTATTFGPDVVCTREQAMTFLWRAAGSPDPVSNVNPFTDVKADAYYYKAILWAVENKITYGVSTTEFGVGDTCNRADIMCFIYRFAGSPAVKDNGKFTDVELTDYFSNAVIWAVGEGVTYGTTATTYGPTEGCTRAQIVTFLYRYFVKK